jgi:mono/diheme cytochrome c family protein
MSLLARACALGAVILAAVTVAMWDAGTTRSTTAARAGGVELFRAKGCASCHDGPDSTAFIDGFPSLKNAVDWAGRRRSEMSAREYLTESIEDPAAFISPNFTGANGPTGAMPNLTLTATEVDALVDYLLST